MARKSIVELIAQANADIPDNTTGLVSPADVRNLIIDFLNAIDSGSQISPNFRDGLKVMEVLEAGMRAAETGSVVKVGQSG